MNICTLERINIFNVEKMQNQIIIFSALNVSISLFQIAFFLLEFTSIQEALNNANSQRAT